MKHRIAQAIAPDHDGRTRFGRVELLPHQREAVAVLRRSLHRHGGALLADPVGTGKTYVALALATTYSRALIVAPAALRTMWSEALHTTATTAEVVSFESLSRGARAPEVRNGLVI
ncbi:MAG: DEAD/DEAH box helicase family protein, partial [Gemmatimonadaceae bacterium]